MGRKSFSPHRLFATMRALLQNEGMINLRSIVPEDAEALAHVLVTANEHAFRGRVPDQCLEFTEAESAANWKRSLADGLPDDDVMLVAETLAGLVVGYGWGGPNTKDTFYGGELRQISILPDYQRRGIGRQLVSRVARQLSESGITTMRVEVLRVNPNRAFYERLGAQFVSEYDYDWDGVTLPMCVYGWQDTSSLVT